MHRWKRKRYGVFLAEKKKCINFMGNYLRTKKTILKLCAEFHIDVVTYVNTMRRNKRSRLTFFCKFFFKMKKMCVIVCNNTRMIVDLNWQ